MAYAYTLCDATHSVAMLLSESEQIYLLPIKVKEESEKVGWKLYIQKTKIMLSGPITSWQIDEKTMERWKQWKTLFSWAPKSLQFVTAVMKLKDIFAP